jgi:hypothetical protein
MEIHLLDDRTIKRLQLAYQFVLSNYSLPVKYSMMVSNCQV